MTKRILSVILVLTVFFGGYALIPKKYNLLPVNDAYCATNYGGVYRAKRDFKVCYRTVTIYYSDGTKVIVKYYKNYSKNQTITLTNAGKDSTDTRVSLVNNMSDLYLLYH